MSTNEQNAPEQNDEQNAPEQSPPPVELNLELYSATVVAQDGSSAQTAQLWPNRGTALAEAEAMADRAKVAIVKVDVVTHRINSSVVEALSQHIAALRAQMAEQQQPQG
jgi:hypothetical protein